MLNFFAEKEETRSSLIMCCIEFTDVPVMFLAENEEAARLYARVATINSGIDIIELLIDRDVDYFSYDCQCDFYVDEDEAPDWGRPTKEQLIDALLKHGVKPATVAGGNKQLALLAKGHTISMRGEFDPKGLAWDDFVDIFETRQRRDRERSEERSWRTH